MHGVTGNASQLVPRDWLAHFDTCGCGRGSPHHGSHLGHCFWFLSGQLPMGTRNAKLEKVTLTAPSRLLEAVRQSLVPLDVGSSDHSMGLLCGGQP